MDATDKKHVYNQVPADILNTYGFVINPQTLRFSFFTIKNNNPSKQLIFINAAILPNGNMSGTADITSNNYIKAKSLSLYKHLGEEKYRDYLSDYDNNLKISAFGLDSAGVDSLPLIQHIDFNLNLTASDDKYIYFNPNLFTSYHTNPFKNEDRFSNIDFIFNSTDVISGIFKIPDGYKVEALPQNQSFVMEDRSMSFKRYISEQDGSVQVRYVITRDKSYFQKEEYPQLYKFYKEMFEMLNEQIVLKKS